MDYRDDREALHLRVAQLEDQLASAKREGKEEGLGEARELEAKVVRMRAELEKMSGELASLRGTQPNRQPVPNTLTFDGSTTTVKTKSYELAFDITD